jgi:hypothetical protein
MGEISPLGESPGLKDRTDYLPRNSIVRHLDNSIRTCGDIVVLLTLSLHLPIVQRSPTPARMSRSYAGGFRDAGQLTTVFGSTRHIA